MMLRQTAVARPTSASVRIARRFAELGMPPSRSIAAAVALGLALVGIAGAATEKPALSVYTYSSFAGEYGPGATIKERFEASCACILEWVQTDDAGTLLARLKLERESTEADVVLGLDNNLMAEATATGLFAPHGIESGKLD